MPATALALLVVAALAVDVSSTSWAPDRTTADAKRTAAWISAHGVASGRQVYSDVWPIRAGT